MVKLPNFAYDWLLTAKDDNLSLVKALNENYTESYAIDQWFACDENHIKDFVDAWCGEEIELIEDMYVVYYIDNNYTKHYMKNDYNSTTNKLDAAQLSKPEWQKVFPKAISSEFLLFEKVGD